MRLLGLDYGSVTVGVAVSDPLGMTAQALETITRDKENHLRSTMRRLEELASAYAVEGIVLGFPLNMDDTIGDRAQKTLAFKDQLEKRLQVPVFLCDERLTTVEADEVLQEMGVPKSERKKYIDKIAAAIILQGYLNERAK